MLPINGEGKLHSSDAKPKQYNVYFCLTFLPILITDIIEIRAF